MHVLRVRNVNDAYDRGVALFLTKGKRQSSRAGEVFALEEPLAVVYERPQERVLFDPVRDANPFFHFFESLWLLAGRQDAKWLDRFVGDFSSRFAEEDGTLHGSYGFRWRRHFDLDGEGNPNMPDQLNTAVRLLKKNPADRRVVIQMWDPVADLGQDLKDVPCNLTVVPRIRLIEDEPEPFGGMPGLKPVLDITVFNRSNDLIWGLTGANAVQFSMLQEYLAGRIGVGIGTYTQVSTNAHMYVSTVPKATSPMPFAYPEPHKMANYWVSWDQDLRLFFLWVSGDVVNVSYTNYWFEATATPLYQAHLMWKNGNKEDAAQFLVQRRGIAEDWRQACVAWMERRLARMSERQEFAR